MPANNRIENEGSSSDRGGQDADSHPANVYQAQGDVLRNLWNQRQQKASTVP